MSAGAAFSQFLSSTLVGRDEERRAIAAFFDADTPVMVLEGEAGIGKSRLLREAVIEAERRGLNVLRGYSDQAAAGTPFSLIADILERCAGDTPLEGLPPGVVGMLSRIAPSLGPTPESPGDGVEDSELPQRVGLAFIRVVQSLQQRRPTLLVLEDLHWADEPSLHVLHALARRTTGARVVLTCRPEDAGQGVTHLLAELERHRMSLTIAVRRLDLAQTAIMVAGIVGNREAMRRGALEQFFQLTQGNPFFVEELLKSLAVAGHVNLDDKVMASSLVNVPLPRTVTDAVVQRLGYLSPVAARVIAVAAAVGQRFDFDVLRVVTGLEEQVLLQAVRELVSAQLVAEEGNDAFGFRHALTRVAIYEGLLTRERTALHREVASAMEAMGSARFSRADLADQLFRAEEWESACRHCIAAGEEALAYGAPAAAERYFAQALVAAESGGIQVPVTARRGRGKALETLGDFAAARDDYEGVLRLARDISDRQLEWQSLIDLGFLALAGGYMDSEPYFRKALALAESLGDPRIEARSLNRLGNWALNVGRLAEAQQRHDAALAIFEDLGDDRGIAETLDLRGMTAVLAGDLLGAVHSYDRAKGLFESLGERQLLSGALATRPSGGAHLVFELAALAMPPPDGSNSHRRAVAIADDIQSPAARAYALMQVAGSAGGRGDYADAFRAIDMAIEAATEINHRQWLVGASWVRGVLLLEIGLADRAEEALREALNLARSTGSTHWVVSVVNTLALALIDAGNLREAGQLIDETATLGVPEDSMDSRYVAFAEAHLCLARGDFNLARARADALLAPLPGPPWAAPRVTMLRGEAMLRSGDAAAAVSVLEQAGAEAERIGALPVLRRILTLLGEAQTVLGRGDLGLATYQRARDVAEAIGATIPDLEWREQFYRYASRSLPPAVRRRPLGAAARGAGVLSQRERDVVVLVARGLSNREIADTLVVSERTAATHVSNILAKLGFGSRAQIASWAVANRVDGQSGDQNS